MPEIAEGNTATNLRALRQHLAAARSRADAAAALAERLTAQLPAGVADAAPVPENRDIDASPAPACPAAESTNQPDDRPIVTQDKPDVVPPQRQQIPQRVFAVITWGCAASKWLAHTLNSHPDIFCGHALNICWSLSSGQPRLNGVEYFRCLKDCFSSYSAVGDVHGLAYASIPQVRNAFGRGFNAAVLVREPMTRLRSILGLFADQAAGRGWDVSSVQECIDAGVSMPQDCYENRLVLLGVTMLNLIEMERDLAPIWRQEDLTTDAAVLGRFVYEMTGIEVAPDGDWVRSAVTKPKINSHISAPATFEEWIVDAIRKIVKPRAWELYGELGYPVPDFVTV